MDRRSAITAALMAMILLGACDDKEGTSRPSGEGTTQPVAVKGAATEKAETAEPGIIQGTVRTSDGRPIKGFKVSIWGNGQKAGQNKTFTFGGTEGKYSREVGPGQFTTRAWTDVEYHGRKYRIDLHPADGVDKLTQQETKEGLIKDFVWQLDGPRAGAAADGDHYGGTVTLYPEGRGQAFWAVLRGDFKHKPETVIPLETVVEVTLTPDGPLIDGSEGKAIVIKQKPGDVKLVTDRMMQGIPIGRYKVSAKATEPDGSTREIKVTVWYPFKARQPPAPAQTAVLEFTPASLLNETQNDVTQANLLVMY